MRTFLKKQYRKYLQRKATRLYTSLPNRFGTFERVYHIHLRKTAGTSVNSAFWNQAGLGLQDIKRKPLVIKQGWIFVRNNLTLINKGHYHFGNSHIPVWKLSLPPQTYTFCMFREPMERLVSLYRYYLWIQQTPAEEAIKIEPYYHSIASKIPFMGNSFTDFLTHLPKKHLQNQLYMFSETYDVEEALEHVAQVHTVCFQSEFEKGITQLSEALNVSLQVQRERKFEAPHIVLNEEEQKLAQQLLKEEYNFYRKLVDLYANT